MIAYHFRKHTSPHLSSPSPLLQCCHSDSFGVPIDPYVDHNNSHFNGVVDMTNDLEGNLQEQIPLDVYALLHVLRSYMTRNDFNFTHVMILTSYNAQVNLIRHGVRRFFSDVFLRDDYQNLVFELTSTVTVSQGTDNWLVI